MNNITMQLNYDGVDNNIGLKQDLKHKKFQMKTLPINEICDSEFSSELDGILPPSFDRPHFVVTNGNMSKKAGLD